MQVCNEDWCKESQAILNGIAPRPKTHAATKLLHASEACKPGSCLAFFAEACLLAKSATITFSTLLRTGRQVRKLPVKEKTKNSIGRQLIITTITWSEHALRADIMRRALAFQAVRDGDQKNLNAWCASVQKGHPLRSEDFSKLLPTAVGCAGWV